MQDAVEKVFAESVKEAAKKAYGKLGEARPRLTAEFVEMFSATAFHNEYTFHPRLFSGFATELVNGFLSYLDLFDEELPGSMGRKSAETGLGEKTAIGISAIIQRTALDALDNTDHASFCFVVKAVNSFVHLYLESFMRARFDRLLHEQELMRTAVSRVEGGSGVPKP